jgi:hypothetical protein
MEARMAKAEINIEHTNIDIIDIKKLLNKQDERIDKLEIMKFRMQGVGTVLTAGVFGLAIKVFFFDIHY